MRKTFLLFASYGLAAVIASSTQSQAVAEQVAIIQPLQLKGMSSLAYLTSKQKAAAFMAASKWIDAEPLLEHLAEAYPYDGQTWRDLGTIQFAIHRYAEAAAAFSTANQYGLESDSDDNAADTARAFALAGHYDDAQHWLETALYRFTYREPAKLLADPAFDNMRNTAAFRSLSGQNTILANGSRTEKLMADLDYFMGQYATFRFPKLSQVDVDRVQRGSAELRGRLSELSNDEVVVEFQRLAALAPGGHNTSPSLGKGLGIDGEQLLSLPLNLYLFSEGLFVIGSNDHRYDNLIGARVISFGGVSTSEMLQRVAPLIDRDPGADTNVVWHSPEYLSNLPVLHDLGGTNTANTVTLRLDTKRGPQSITFQGVPHTASPKLYPSRIASQPPPISLAHIADNFWYDDIGNGTVYVQFNQVIDKANERLRDFGVRLRKHLTEINARTLIVDTRYNGGGNTFEYLELLRTLVAFDAQAGHQLYYVEGRDTFSAAVNFTTDVRRLTKAIFVGEPCSAPRAAGDPVFITLPNSGIQVKFSTNTWALYYPDDDRRWIPPDMPVTLTATDYFANRDPVLDAINSAMEQPNPSLEIQ